MTLFGGKAFRTGEICGAGTDRGGFACMLRLSCGVKDVGGRDAD